jgi:5'(3')-deoxyribonucleotidase
MRIGIDCDGVLRDLITCITDTVKVTHPQHADKILESTSWDWDQWLPFWTNDETEKYVFEDNFLDFFGVECPPIKSSVEDWPKLRAWAIENGHKLCLVSAQRPHCVEPTEAWLQRWGFVGFDEIHFTKEKHLVDVDVLIDDSPEKLEKFEKESVKYGTAICFNQSWNKDFSDTHYMNIDRLSDIMGMLYEEDTLK